MYRLLALLLLGGCFLSPLSVFAANPIPLAQKSDQIAGASQSSASKARLAKAGAAAAEKNGLYSPTHVVLPNGLNVIIVPNHRAPVIHAMLWYRVGALDEAAGQSGLAHFLEHLMFKSTTTMASGQFSKNVAAVGGRDNAFTSHDYTAYFATVPADFLPTLLAMEADRMQFLSLNDSITNPERDVVLAERRQRTDDNPRGRFSEKLYQKIYGNHPYGRPVIGWRHEVETMNAATAMEFYKRWYAPNNVVLVLSGDISPQRAITLVDLTLGKVPSRPLPARAAIPAMPQRGKDETLFVQDKDVQQTTLQRHYTAPTYQSARGYEAYALQVLAEILDGGAVGRLYRHAVIAHQVATETSVGYDPMGRAGGSLAIALTLPPTNANVGKATAAIDAVLTELLDKGVTTVEVEQAVQRLQRAAVLSRDQLATPGYAFGQALMVGLNVQTVENWPAMIGKVTVNDVNAAARALFARRDFVTAVLLPAETLKNAVNPAQSLPNDKQRMQ